MDQLVTFTDRVDSGVVTLVPAARAREFLVRLFVAAGTPDDIAEVAAEHLVLANLSGFDSHGIVHITHYLHEMSTGALVPAARPEIVEERAASAVVDGHHGWGLYAGMRALDIAAAKARETGVGAVSVRRCGHIGRLGHYAEAAAADGLISFITWGAGRPVTWGPPRAGYHLAVPFGGGAPALSTNPFAFGVPTGDDAPFVVDFATTVIANAKAWILRERGEPLPAEAALDRDGQPTTDPAVYMDGGMLRIFGAHKGYGISLLTTLLGGLTGTGVDNPHGMEGPFFLVIDPGAFGDADTYVPTVRSFLDGIRATPPAPGCAEVLVPGDFEVRSRTERAVLGIEITPSVRVALERAAQSLQVAFDLLDEPITDVAHAT